jgi:hypothetical protein
LSSVVGVPTPYALLAAVFSVLVSFVLWTLRSINQGRLVPGKTHDEIVRILTAESDRIAKDRDQWREVALTSSRQADAMLSEYGPTATQILRALPRSGQEADP